MRINSRQRRLNLEDHIMLIRGGSAFSGESVHFIGIPCICTALLITPKLTKDYTGYKLVGVRCPPTVGRWDNWRTADIADLDIRVIPRRSHLTNAMRMSFLGEPRWLVLENQPL